MEYPKTSLVANGMLAVLETGSTNQDLLALAASNQHPEFFTLITEFQTAGRGRLDRKWQAAPGSSVMASVLLRPNFKDQSGVGWLSLMMAEAIKTVLAELGIDSKIKWPNDVLVNGLKISGVLAEANSALSAVVVGFGINVNQGVKELPTSSATSLMAAGADSVDRDDLLAQTLRSFKQMYQELVYAEGDATVSGLRSRILESSATIGELVEVSFPDGTSAVGEAVDIDASGRLQVLSATQTLSVSAGDVLHLRTTKLED
jgi:BirA family biotin operon repressor/biotin-[acetyl-CoA-carboxylase] ligase